MTINDALDALIAQKPQTLQTLNDLIAQLQSETIVSPDPELYEAPTYDDATGIWALKQTTANVDGEYVGEYHLPALDVCSAVNTLNPISFSPPAAPNPPARVLPPGADSAAGWVSLASLLDLIGQSFQAFAIRSATAFEVRTTVTMCPDATISFVAASSTTQEGTTHTVVVRLSLSIGSTPQEIRVPIVVTGGSATSGSDYTLQTTEVVFLVYSVDGTTQNVSLTIAEDAPVEPAETIILGFGTITGPAAPGATASHTVTIEADPCADGTFSTHNYLHNFTGWEGHFNRVRTSVQTPVGQTDSIAVLQPDQYITLNLGGEQCIQSVLLYQYDASSTNRYWKTIRAELLSASDNIVEVLQTNPSLGGVGCGHMNPVTFAPTAPALAAKIRFVGVTYGTGQSGQANILWCAKVVHRD